MSVPVSQFIPPLKSQCFTCCSVVSDSLRPHELQHARPPCPSPTPGVHSDSLSHQSFFIQNAWTARRLNQSIQKEISPEHSLEGLILKLKLQYFGHLMQRTDSLEKILMLGNIKGRKRTGRQRLRYLDGMTWVWASSGSRWWTGRPGVLQSMGLQRIGHDWATELNWHLILTSKQHLHLCQK